MITKVVAIIQLTENELPTILIIFSVFYYMNITVPFKLYIDAQEPDELCLVLVVKCLFATSVHRRLSKS